MNNARVTRNPTPPASRASIIKCADIHAFSHAVGIDMCQICGSIGSAIVDAAKVEECPSGAGNGVEGIVPCRAFGHQTFDSWWRYCRC